MTNAVLLLLSTGLLGQMNETFDQDFSAGQLHPMVELFGPDAAETAGHTGRGLQITLPTQRRRTGRSAWRPSLTSAAILKSRWNMSCSRCNQLRKAWARA